MKKLLALIVVSTLCLHSSAQLIQASVGIGSLPNRIKIYLKANVDQFAAPPSINSLTLNVGVQSAGIVTPPNITIIPSATFPSVTWTLDALSPFNEGGYWNYTIILNTNPTNPVVAANIELEVMEVAFSNGVPGLGTVGLVSLPEGGTTNFGAYFYCNGGVVQSNGMSLLYYTRAGTTTVNQDSYNLSGTGAFTSTALLANIVLPVKFVGFSVVKKDNGANLSWQIENETALTDRYEIERSLNGTDFKTISTIAPKNNGRSANSYASTDADLSTIHSSIIYYRIKQTDKDGQFIYTEIKSIRLDAKAFSASIYPNPVRGKANLSIDLTENSLVTITLNDANGKVLKNIQVQGLKGINKKEVDMSNLSGGNYLLRIQTATETTTLNVVKGN